MIYNNLSCAIAFQIHLFTILCNSPSCSLMFLQSSLNESRCQICRLMAGTFSPDFPSFLLPMGTKKVKSQPNCYMFLFAGCVERDRGSPLKRAINAYGLVRDWSTCAALSMGGGCMCFMKWLAFKIKVVNKFQMSGLIFACRSELCLKLIWFLSGKSTDYRSK